jgi:nitroimidazol reductase NimA-like FMN-containing flavoprotein (pyridoxamine 5'-phosphate oxidase superfamily)
MVTDAPQASRPYMPGYGILDADAGRGLLPWSWATERLAKSHNYWVVTTRPDGRPHVMPVWGVWLGGAESGGAFYFSTGANTRKAQNLAANPSCVVCAERADEAIIVEGVAEPVDDPSVYARFADAYKAKYDWPVEQATSPAYAVRPRVAFAFRENEDFEGSATRWRFSDGQVATDSNAG